MERRKFMIGLGATAALASTPLSAAVPEVVKVPLSENVIFNVLSRDETVRLVKNKYVKPSTTRVTFAGHTYVMEPTSDVEEISIVLQNYKIEDSTVFIDDATTLEQFFIRNSPFAEFYNDKYKLEAHFYTSIEMDPVTRRYTPAPFMINITANQIARATRMGRGNNLIVHTSKVKPLEEMYERVSPKYKVHGRDWMPENECFVFYRSNGKYDVPGSVYETGEVFVNDFNYGRRIVFQA